MPTRCWSSYLTFFGDNQQLQCTAADTCRASRVSSELIVCGNCPTMASVNILDYGCDSLTKLCTCAIPILGTTYCSSNEDCLYANAETTCRFIKDDLSLSVTSVRCDECQFQRMCLHDVYTGLGTCACGFKQRQFQACTPQDVAMQNPISLVLENLCLYTSARIDVAFQTEKVVACQNLDATAGTCAYVEDLQTYMVRGFRVVGRRLLNAESNEETFTYSTLDPICRDALGMKSMVHTRVSCQKMYDASRNTLQLLGMQELLPYCAFCSLADVQQSITQNPLAWSQILFNAKALWTIIQRHSPFATRHGPGADHA